MAAQEQPAQKAKSSKHDPSLSLAANLAAGSAARFSAVSILHPFDVLKTRLQFERASSHGQLTGVQAFKLLLKHEGPSALYKGLGVRLAYILPAAGVNFTIYEQFKVSMTTNDWWNWRLYASLVIGGLARGAMTWLRTPFDIVKQEIQVQGMRSASDQNSSQPPPPKRGVRDVIASIRSTKGVGGLFAGYWVTLGRDIVFSVAYFGSYEGAKYLVNRDSPTGGLKFFLDAAAGGTAGVVATVTSLPIDVVKTRLQTQLQLPTGMQKFNTLHDCIGFMIKEEGPKAFFRGLGPRLLSTIPSASITFATYEQVKRLFRYLEGGKKSREEL